MLVYSGALSPLYIIDWGDGVLKKFIHILYDNILANIVKVIGIVMILAVLLQIAARYLMSHPFSWTEELSRFSFIWFCFLGSVVTYTKNLHLGIDFLYRKFSSKGRMVLDLIINVLIFIFGFVLVKYGITLLGMTSFQQSPVLRIPMSYIYASLPVTGVLFLIFTVYRVKLLFDLNSSKAINTVESSSKL